ncbi:MAG: alpha/beta hydrolase, partial [Candidatus Heimdallarchaeota archaeon]|nr:alpha/beta hydrolase [Candidatus Heimdallarchaeota archaeon]
KDKPYILVGHSMGGSIIIELMSRKPLDNCQGVSLNGASRLTLSHWFLNFLFYLPVPIIYSFFALMVVLFPLNFVLTGFNLHKAKQASFEGITRLIENGAREIKKEYNFCLRKIGKDVTSIHKNNINIPTLFIHLKKEMMVDEEDLKFTKSLYNKKRVKIIKSDTMHLTHDFDYVVADLIGEELDFFGYEKISKSS